MIIRGRKILKVGKMDYSLHPEYPKMEPCKASAHVPEWRKKKQEAAVSTGTPPEKPKTTRASPRKTPKKKTAPDAAGSPVPTAVSSPASVPAPSPSVPPPAPDTVDNKGEPPAEMEIVTVDKESIMS